MFTIGQQVSLWEVSQQPSILKMIVIRQKIVRITETNVSRPDEFTLLPIHHSARAVDDDGHSYEKKWPEHKNDGHTDTWSQQPDTDSQSDDGDAVRFWTPREAVSVFNEYKWLERDGYKLISFTGHKILPTGDIEYCNRHKQYYHSGEECFLCEADGRRFTKESRRGSNLH